MVYWWLWVNGSDFFFLSLSRSIFAALIFCMHLLLDCTLCANKYWIYITWVNSHPGNLMHCVLGQPDTIEIKVWLVGVRGVCVFGVIGGKLPDHDLLILLCTCKCHCYKKGGEIFNQLNLNGDLSHLSLKLPVMYITISIEYGVWRECRIFSCHYVIFTSHETLELFLSYEKKENHTFSRHIP